MTCSCVHVAARYLFNLSILLLSIFFLDRCVDNSLLYMYNCMIAAVVAAVFHYVRFIELNNLTLLKLNLSINIKFDI
jgi:hypothetical protein